MVGVEEALMQVWDASVLYLKNAVGAVILLVIGFLLGKILGKVVKEIIVRLRLDEFVSEEKYLHVKPSILGDVITRWTIYLVFIQQATMVLGVEAISQFVQSAYEFILGVVAAAVTILIGYGIAVYLKDRIITSKTVYSDITGKLVFFLVLYLSIAIGLKFIQGVNTVILDYILLVLIASVGIGMAIALGLGLKDVVAEMARDWLKASKHPAKRRR